MIQLDKREAFPFSSNPFGLVYENAITENKEKNINEEKKLEKPTISEQRINLEELRNQIMNLEIEQSYEEDKKYVKAK